AITDSACASYGYHMPGSHRTAVHRVPRDRERLDERTLERRDPRRKVVRHSPLHHGVLGETARAVIPLDRKRGTVVVLPEAAVKAAPAGLHRFHRHQSPDGEVLAPRPERADFPAQPVTQDHEVAGASHWTRRS